MTEAEWLACTDLQLMLEFLRDKASDRKLRLFACASAKSLKPDTGGEAVEQAVAAGERWADADGSLVASEVEGAWYALWHAQEQALEAHDYSTALRLMYPFTCLSEHDPLFLFVRRAPSLRQRLRSLPTLALDWFLGLRPKQRDPIEEAWCPIARDIFGNLFRPVTIDHRWLTSTVVTLAQTIYQERAFDRVPILADALEEAGCDNSDVLTHLRADGPHVRGCWALDLVLGKE